MTGKPTSIDMETINQSFHDKKYTDIAEMMEPLNLDMLIKH